MWERVQKLRSIKGVSVKKIEEDVGFSNGSLKKISEKTECGRLYALASYFGVSMEYLMGVDEPMQKPPYPMMTFEEEAVAKAYHDADDDIKKAVCKLLDVKRDLLLSRGA